MSYDDVYVYVGQKPTTRACVVLLFKMPTINKTYLILSYLVKIMTTTTLYGINFIVIYNEQQLHYNNEINS